LRDFEPVFRIRVSIRDIDEILDLLREESIVLCESSSLCFYDLYCVHKELDFYIEKERLETVEKKLKQLPTGDFEVKIYISDLPIDTDINYIGGQKITGEVRTVIDLYTVGKSGEAQRLMEKIWPIS
jgi:hypothetical protein